MNNPFDQWLARVALFDRPWRLVMTEARKERDVQAELAAMGWETFLPMERFWTGPAKRRREESRPLFARYLFAACPVGGDGAAAHDVDGVATLWMRLDGRSVVRLELLAKLQLAEVGGAFDACRDRAKAKARTLAVDDNVKINDGVLKGFEARIVRVLSQRKVVARFTLFGRVDEAVFAVADLDAA